MEKVVLWRSSSIDGKKLKVGSDLTRRVESFFVSTLAIFLDYCPRRTSK